MMFSFRFRVAQVRQVIVNVSCLFVTRGMTSDSESVMFVRNTWDDDKHREKCWRVDGW